MIERTFQAMGTEIRLFVGPHPDAAAPGPELAAVEAQAQLADFDRRLSRFLPDSELSRFNRDPAEVLAASPLLRRAVAAGVWAAERTGGLVDPTLLVPLEAAGYATSFRGRTSPALAEALPGAPPRRPATANPEAPWRRFEVDDDAGTIRRPPGLKFDTGGVGKGLAADLVARRLGGHSRFAVDLGGDLLVGGSEPQSEEVEIEVRHPLDGSCAERIRIGSGAVATSGLDARLWARADGSHAHHLLDPASGQPAWTGLICASARAPTAVEADALAKFALLSGADRAGEILSGHGGLIVTDDGSVLRFAARGDCG